MAHARSGPGSQPAPEPSDVQPALQHLWGDPVLRVAFSATALRLAFQLTLTLVQPAWTAPVTASLQVLLGWAGLLVVVLLSRWFTHMSVPEARSWWWVSAGLLANALARTLQLVEL